jgi:hypothetical protein
MALLTPTVNVAAERAKLRRLRNEINADAQARLAYERHYTARGYRRAQVAELPVVPSPRHEPAVRQGADDVPALLRQAGGQDAAQQGAGQGHAGGDCMAPGKPAAGAGAGAGGQTAEGVNA